MFFFRPRLCCLTRVYLWQQYVRGWVLRRLETHCDLGRLYYIILPIALTWKPMDFKISRVNEDRHCRSLVLFCIFCGAPKAVLM
jgi:hypothetical protein